MASCLALFDAEPSITTHGLVSIAESVVPAEHFENRRSIMIFCRYSAIHENDI